MPNTDKPTQSPGPWSADLDIVRDANGNDVCMVDGIDNQRGRPTSAELDRANARLIAEAPAMLDVLRRAVADELQRDGDLAPWFPAAVAVLARIDGGRS